MRVALTLGLVCLLTGCSDPATQAPLALKPGQYDISALGESYV